VGEAQGVSDPHDAQIVIFLTDEGVDGAFEGFTVGIKIERNFCAGEAERGEGVGVGIFTINGIDDACRGEIRQTDSDGIAVCRRS
jgi:hypothetical protein